MAIFPLILFTVMLDRLSERETTQCVGKKQRVNSRGCGLNFFNFTVMLFGILSLLGKFAEGLYSVMNTSSDPYLCIFSITRITMLIKSLFQHFKIVSD